MKKLIAFLERNHSELLPIPNQVMNMISSMETRVHAGKLIGVIIANEPPAEGRPLFEKPPIVLDCYGLENINEVNYDWETHLAHFTLPWAKQDYLSCIAASMEICWRHKLPSQYGAGLTCSKRTIYSIGENHYEAINECQILISKGNWPLITLMSVQLISEWTLDDFPINTAPRLSFMGKEHPFLLALSDTIAYQAKQGMLSYLGLSDRAQRVLKLTSENYNSKIEEIAGILEVKTSTVGFDNLQIIALFQSNFSTMLDSARLCAKFAKRAKMI